MSRTELDISQVNGLTTDLANIEIEIANIGNGASGYSGYSGATGAGASGYSGYSSASGYSGYSGTVGAGAITLSNMANLAANSIIGNNTGSITTPLALSITQANTLLLAQPRGTTSTLMTGATTALTVSSTRQQIFTGSGATVQTVTYQTQLLFHL